MNTLLQKTIILVLFLGISFSICYWAIAKYDVNTDLTACSDAEQYIKMSKMDFTGVQKPFRHRILMPSLVYVLNRYLNMNHFLSKYYDNVEKKTIQLNFGIINIINLALAGFMLFYFCLHLGFNNWEGLVGSLLFFTSFFVVNYYSVPLVDSLAAFFIISCFYAVLRNSGVGLMLSFLFGVFAKETTFLIVLLVILDERRIFSKKLLYCLPGIIAYLIFINISKCSEGWSVIGLFSDPHYLSNLVTGSFKNVNALALIELVQTFMFLWLLFLYAIFKLKKPLFVKRSLWLLLLPLIFAPLGGSPAAGRVTFFLFPIVIPLSLLTLRKVFDQKNVVIV